MPGGTSRHKHLRAGATGVRRKLPIGIQTFRKMREDGAYYVDKTPFMERLLGDGTHFFLSRPRRFGKSLFLDTLKELFEGSEELFERLAIHGRWDWSARHPVIRLSFGSGLFGTPDGLRLNVMAQLGRLEREAGLELTNPSAPERFSELIRALRERDGERAVVLIDEYDKPILDALEVPEVAKANRDFLRDGAGVSSRGHSKRGWHRSAGVELGAAAACGAAFFGLGCFMAEMRLGVLC